MVKKKTKEFFPRQLRGKTNINNSVCSFLRQLTTWHCPHLLLHSLLRRPCSNRSIYSGRRAHSSKPAASECSRQRGRQADGFNVWIALAVMLFLSVTFNYNLCMTLTYKLDLGMVKVNHHAKYLRESNASVIRSKVMFETHTHTHTHTHTYTSNRLHYSAANALGKTDYHKRFSPTHSMQAVVRGSLRVYDENICEAGVKQRVSAAGTMNDRKMT